MGLSLNLIVNTSLKNNPNKKDWDRIVAQLKALNTERSWKQRNSLLVQETGDWSHRISKPFYENDDLHIDFYGPFNFEILLYNHIAEISTIHRYQYLYTVYGSKFYKSFRQNLFQPQLVFSTNSDHRYLLHLS